MSWGADNLHSPKWRKAFQDVLNITQEIDVDLTAKALQQDAPDLGYSEAQRIAQGQEDWEKHEQDIDDEFDKIKEWLRSELVKIGVTDTVARKMVYWASNWGMQEIDRNIKFQNVPREWVVKLVDEWFAIL